MIQNGKNQVRPTNHSRYLRPVLDQTKDQYPNFSQNTLSNDQWYEQFNTKIDVGSSIDVTRQNKVIIFHVATNQ